MFCRSLFSDTLGRIPRGIHTGNSNVLCVLLHFSLCVKPPCSFVMRLPNRLDCSMEVFLPTLFLFTPGRTRGFVKPEGTKNTGFSFGKSGLLYTQKPLAGRVVQKRHLPMRKNKTPTAIVGMRSGNSKLQNRGRSFKNEVAETV